MSRFWPMLVAVCALVAGGGVVVRALADGDTPDGGAPPGAPDASPGGASGTRDPFVDLVTIPMRPEEVTAEEIEESERLAREFRADGPERAGRPSREQRLEWSRAAERAEEERVRTRTATGFPEERHARPMPGAAACRTVCDFLVGTCMGTAAGDEHRACREGCGRGAFGDRRRVDKILGLWSCDHY